jgi:signal transduction histidine kinase
MSRRSWAVARPDRWGILVGRAVGTIGYAVAVVHSSPPHLRLAAAAFAGVTVAGGAYGWRWGSDQPTRRLIGVAAIAAGGVTLLAVDPHSVGWLAVGIGIATALARLPLRMGAITAAVIAAAAVTVSQLRGVDGGPLAIAGSCAGFALLGVTLGGARQRAEAAERLLASEQSARNAEQAARDAALAAREATARTHAYAERQRLAREIHDILAHTLSAQIVGLEGARLLVRRGAPAEAVLGQIDQAQRLAREGLEETRRAVYSLRGQARPLSESLRSLAEASGARFDVHGDPRPVEPEVGLALERTTQEALTNARKHAPGATTSIDLRFLDGWYEVEVRDTGAADGGSVLADSGGGYGLAGMRERAELLGGELSAGPYPVAPDGSGYRVWLRIPT